MSGEELAVISLYLMKVANLKNKDYPFNFFLDKPKN